MWQFQSASQQRGRIRTKKLTKGFSKQYKYVIRQNLIQLMKRKEHFKKRFKRRQKQVYTSTLYKL